MFGKFLRAARERKKQTQIEAAEAIGVHNQTYSCWERGHRPSLEQAFKIADWAGVTLDELRRQLEDAA
jgi:transcriptional regulator with XRE-family HTH domain